MWTTVDSPAVVAYDTVRPVLTRLFFFAAAAASQKNAIAELGTFAKRSASRHHSGKLGTTPHFAVESHGWPLAGGLRRLRHVWSSEPVIDAAPSRRLQAAGHVRTIIANLN